MLTMQDPEDGGVYHKLTTPSFEGFIKPEDCKKTRYVVQKSVTAALDFAASMAQASRIYKAYENDFPGLSDKCLKAAISAFEWAKKHPDTFYNQTENNKKFKPEITTGAENMVTEMQATNSSGLQQNYIEQQETRNIWNLQNRNFQKNINLLLGEMLLVWHICRG